MKRMLEVSVLSSSAYTLLSKRALAVNHNKANNLTVDIVCCAGKEVSLMREQGLNVHELSLPNNLNPFKFTKAAWDFYQLVKKENYDLVHLHFAIPGVLGRTVAFFDRKRTYIYQAHGYAFDKNTPKYKLAAPILIEKLLKNRVKYASFQLKEDIDMARKHGLLHEDQLKYIGNGIDISRFSRALEGSNIADGSDAEKGKTVVFGMVAGFKPVKNHRYLLEAVDILAKRITNFSVELIGKGDLKEALIAEIKAKGLEKHVRVNDYTLDITEFYKAIDVGLLTSYFEGIPRALMEPMCMRKPVICTDVKGSRELVEHGMHGFKVNINTPGQLAECMQQLIESPKLRNKLGAAARGHIITNFSEEQVIKRLEAIYQQALQDG